MGDLFCIPVWSESNFSVCIFHDDASNVPTPRLLVYSASLPQGLSSPAQIELIQSQFKTTIWNSLLPSFNSEVVPSSYCIRVVRSSHWLRYYYWSSFWLSLLLLVFLLTVTATAGRAKQINKRKLLFWCLWIMKVSSIIHMCSFRSKHYKNKHWL